MRQHRFGQAPLCAIPTSANRGVANQEVPLVAFFVGEFGDTSMGAGFIIIPITVYYVVFILIAHVPGKLVFFFQRPPSQTGIPIKPCKAPASKNMDGQDGVLVCLIVCLLFHNKNGKTYVSSWSPFVKTTNMVHTHKVTKVQELRMSHDYAGSWACVIEATLVRSRIGQPPPLFLLPGRGFPTKECSTDPGGHSLLT